MGGRGYLYQLTPRAGVAQKPLLAVNKKVWGIVDASVRRLTRFSPSLGVMLSDYWAIEARENLPSWPLPPAQLGFSFGDAGGGCSMSMCLSLHWVQIVLSKESAKVDAALAQMGWALAGPLPPVEHWLEAPPEYVMAHVGSHYYCVHQEGEEISLWSDADAPELRFETLPEWEKTRIRRQLETRSCVCPVCSELRRERARRLRLSAAKTRKETSAQAREAAKKQREEARAAREIEARAKAEARAAREEARRAKAEADEKARRERLQAKIDKVAAQRAQFAAKGAPRNTKPPTA